MKVLVLGKATERSEAGEFGSPDEFAAMDRYFQQLNEAGIVLAADGLQPSSKAKHARSRRAGSGRGTPRRYWLVCDPGADRGLPRQGGACRRHRWVRIASLYGDLVALTRSPIVELNRAVAELSMADGPAAGLAVTDGLLDVAALRSYHLLPSVRSDLLAELGRTVEARAQFERAAQLTSNAAERAHLLARASSS